MPAGWDADDDTQRVPGGPYGPPAENCEIASHTAIKAAKTTKLLTGDEWVEAPGKASTVGTAYRPAR